MCVAILQLPGVEVPLWKLDNGAAANRDGAGYAFIEDGRIHTRRSLKWDNIRDQFVKDRKRRGKQSPFLIHFRIATHGTVSRSNCHPFRMLDGGAMIHNGIIPGMNADRPDEQSDTQWFVKRIMDKMPMGWQNDPVWCSFMEEAIGHSKCVFLWPLPDDRWQYLILNQSKGHWEQDNGVWFSNYSCNSSPRTKSPDPKAVGQGTPPPPPTPPRIPDRVGGGYSPPSPPKNNNSQPSTQKSSGTSSTGLRTADPEDWGPPACDPTRFKRIDRNRYVLMTEGERQEAERMRRVEDHFAKLFAGLRKCGYTVEEAEAHIDVSQWMFRERYCPYCDERFSTMGRAIEHYFNGNNKDVGEKGIACADEALAEAEEVAEALAEDEEGADEGAEQPSASDADGNPIDVSIVGVGAGADAYEGPPVQRVLDVDAQARAEALAAAVEAQKRGPGRIGNGRTIRLDRRMVNRRGF